MRSPVREPSDEFFFEWCLLIKSKIIDSVFSSDVLAIRKRHQLKGLHRQSNQSE